MITDPIADLLTRLRNAIKANHCTLELKSSRIKKNIVQLLHGQGYIQNYKFDDEQTPQGSIKIELKYTRGVSPIVKLIRKSRPGLRKYCKAEEIPRVLNGLGVGFYSTSKGVKTDKQARKENIGGEYLFEVY